MTRASDFPLERDVLITVKAYPNPSNKYQETVCVAGVTKEEGWVWPPQPKDSKQMKLL
jgi:hypothetical protein